MLLYNHKQEPTQRRIYKMKIKVLHQGDKVLNVTSEFIVIKRVNGEVDIIPIVVTDMGPRVEMSNIVTIGYGDNVVETETEDGVKIISF